MKHKLTISIFVGLMLSDWMNISHTLSSVLAVEAPDHTCVHVGRIISVQGEVQLMRKNWSNYHPTAVGTELCVGDLLLPASQATVIVQCADPKQNLWTVTDGQPSGAAIGCRSPKEPIHTITKPITPTRKSLARRIPYIISPQKTWLLNDKPQLRWTTVPDATSYIVRVSGPGVNWITEVKTSSVVYPGESPLKPGEGYLLTVEADNGETAKTIFGLLDEKKAALVRTSAERIAKQNLTDEAKTLALAELYIGQELIAEAMELLSGLVTKGSKTAAVYYMLGNLYAQAQLFYQAEASYLKAVPLATTANNIEGQAVAAAKLAQVYAVLGKSDAATYWHQQAQKGYKSLFSLKPVAD